MIRGIRGATSVETDDEAAIRQAVIIMMDAIIKQNSLQTEQVITLFVTVTDDLHAISPARVVREQYHWDLVPILCAQEPEITGLPAQCIRVLIQFETDREARDVRHVYQNGALVLRPDR